MSEKTEEEKAIEAQELADKLEAERLAKLEEDGDDTDEDDDEEEELSVEELKQKLADERAARKKEQDSKSRVEKESRDWKKKFQAQRKKEEQEEEERLNKEGKTDELLEKERARTKSLQDKLVNTTTSTLREKLENKILKLNPSVIDVDDVIHNLDKELYEVDADSMTITGVGEALKDVLERKPHLFGKKKMPKSSSDNPETRNKGKMVSHEDWAKLPLKLKREKMRLGLVEGLPSKTG